MIGSSGCDIVGVLSPSSSSKQESGDCGDREAIAFRLVICFSAAGKFALRGSGSVAHFLVYKQLNLECLQMRNASSKCTVLIPTAALFVPPIESFAIHYRDIFMTQKFGGEPIDDRAEDVTGSLSA